MYAWFVLFNSWWLVGMGSALFPFSYALLASYENLLKYTERMSYLLSQGEHVCDIALMYPTESMQAYPDMTADNNI